jgi:hypothetical protein
MTQRHCALFIVSLLAALLGLLLVMLRSADVTDGLLWRFERFEGSPVLGQRVFERKLLDHHRVQDALIKPETMLLFGDSHLAALPPSQLGMAHNFAMGGESAARLAIRLPSYRSLLHARGVVLGAGTNDLAEGASVDDVLSAWDRLLASIPEPRRLLCIGMPQPGVEDPRATAFIQVNRGVAQRCEALGARFLAITPGKGAWAQTDWASDGVHLNLMGARRLIELIHTDFEQSRGHVPS